MELGSESALRALRASVILEIGITKNYAELMALFHDLEEISLKLEKISLATSTGENQIDLFVIMTNKILDSFEGERSDAKYDPGQATMYGLSARFHPELAPFIKDGTLTRDRAIRTYRELYYNPLYKIDKLPGALQFIIFDAKIHGSFESVKSIQEWLNLKENTNLKIDGFYGKNTYDALMKLSKGQISNLIFHLKLISRADAAKAAARTMRSQRNMGIAEYNYSHGFTNRLNGRYEFSETLLG